MADPDLLRTLGIAVPEALPPHLQGVPRSLHKYEPLLRRSWAQRERVPG